jgi:hypothetical protein
MGISSESWGAWRGNEGKNLSPLPAVPPPCVFLGYKLFRGESLAGFSRPEIKRQRERKKMLLFLVVMELSPRWYCWFSEIFRGPLVH